MTNQSLAIIIPAYREINNLLPAYEGVLRIVQKADIVDHEIIIITNTRRDGTDDGTPALAAKIAAEHEHTRHMHNNSYVGLGYKFYQGARAATKDYVMLIPGSGEFVEDTVVGIIKYIGEADIIVTYNSNPESRAFKRRIVSRCFTIMCNLLFGLHLRYYNGLNILPRKYMKNIPAKSEGFTYMAEILIYLIKSGVSYIEIPWDVKPANDPQALHSAFNLRTVFETLGTLARLFWQVHFLRKRAVLSS